METIAENLQILVDQKQAIKESLENQGKEPTEKISTYAGLIAELENPDQVTYCVTVDGENKTYATLYGEERAELTATPNDIRTGTVAITDDGLTTGEKDIPAYHTTKGTVAIRPNDEFSITTLKDKYDYTELFCLIAPYNKNLLNSVAVDKTVLNNAVYPVSSTQKLADVVKDATNKAIKLGITNGSTPYVIHFMTYREEA